MATITTGSVVLMDGYNFSSYFQSVEFKGDVDIKDSSNLGTTGAREYQPGLAERMVSGEGFFASGAVTTSLDAKFETAFSSTANKLITIGQEGASTQGLAAIMMNTKQAKFDISTKVGELIMAKLDAKATLDGSIAAFALGKWIYQATLTGTANGATYDNAASSTGYLATAHITDCDDGYTVKLQHSTNGSTWADLVDFGKLSNAAGQAFNTSTTVNRYLRGIISASHSALTGKVWLAVKTGYTGLG